MSSAELWRRAQYSTAQLTWMKEYAHRWRMELGNSKALLHMCHENKKGDPAAIDLLNSMVAMAEVKVGKCEAWIAAHEPEHERLMSEVIHGND